MQEGHLMNNRRSIKIKVGFSAWDVPTTSRNS
jgi:hypothetical protein